MQQESKSAAIIRQQSPASHVQSTVEHGLRYADAQTAKVCILDAIWDTRPVTHLVFALIRTVKLIMREMIQTERDYVKSLEYVIENYVPMLLKEEIPQALRGQRNVIFGNIEKIYEFHSQHFLKELERHENCPLQVGESFLKHVSTPFFFFFNCRAFGNIYVYLYYVLTIYRKRNSTCTRSTTKTSQILIRSCPSTVLHSLRSAECPFCFVTQSF